MPMIETPAGFVGRRAELAALERHYQAAHSGLVPVGNEIFKKILVRSSPIPQIDPHKFSLQHWTERRYYEVCSNPAIYAMLEGKSASKV